MNASVGNIDDDEIFFCDPSLSDQIKIENDLVHILRRSSFDIGQDCAKVPVHPKLIGLLDFSPEISIDSLSKNVNDELAKCSKCGLCLAECPQYQKNKTENFSPRSLIIRLSYGDISSTNEFISSCKELCQDDVKCEIYCPTGVSFLKIIAELGS